MSFTGSHVVLPHVSRTGRPRVQGIPATYRGRRIPQDRQVARPQILRNFESGIQEYLGKKNIGIRSMVKYQRKRKIRRRYKPKVKKSIPLLWPRHQLIKTKATALISLDTSTTYVGIIKANSLNDPMAGFGNTYGYGLDQWSQFYQSYVVVASKAILKVHQTSINGSTIVGLHLSKEATSRTSSAADVILDYRERPYTATKMLTSDFDKEGMAMKYNAKKFWRVRKFRDAEDQHGTLGVSGGALSSVGDPTDQTYYHIFVGDTNASGQATCEGVLTVTYYVYLFDRREPARTTI